MLRIDAILHLAPPAGPKGRMYDIYGDIYIIYTDTGALISIEELALLATRECYSIGRAKQVLHRRDFLHNFIEPVTFAR